MLRISAIELLNKHLSESADEHVVVAARGGLEVSFLSSVQKITVYGLGREMFFTELVVVAMSQLNPIGLETILGLNKAGRRVFIYHQIRDLLSERCRDFWDANEACIRKGVLIDEDWEAFLRVVGYPNLGYRWKLLASSLLKKLIKKHRMSCSVEVLKRRIEERKDHKMVFPWRTVHLQEIVQSANKKRILANPERIDFVYQSLDQLLSNQPKGGIQQLILWDDVSDIMRYFDRLQRVCSPKASVWTLSEETVEPWLHTMSDTFSWKRISADHFSYDDLYWITLK